MRLTLIPFIAFMIAGVFVLVEIFDWWLLVVKYKGEGVEMAVLTVDCCLLRQGCRTKLSS